MDMIRILVGMNSACAEPDLPILFIDAIDAANHPFSRCDRVLDGTRVGVDQVQVVPAIALGHPDKFARLFKVIVVSLEGIIDEGVALFVDNRRNFAGLRVHGQPAADLMSALVIEEGETVRVSVPVEGFQAPGVGKEGVVQGDFAPTVHFEQVRLCDGDAIAGLAVLVVEQAGLKHVGRGRFDQMDARLVSLRGPKRQQFRRVGRPEKPGFITVEPGSFGRKRKCLVLFFVSHEHIMIANKG